MYTSKFIFNILFSIIVCTLHFFFSFHTYLYLHGMYSIQCFAVFTSGQWFAVSHLFFLYLSSNCFCSYLSLTQPDFVSTYLYYPVCHKFRICIFIQFSFINLFNVFYLQMFYYSDQLCNPLYNIVVCNPLVYHSYKGDYKTFKDIQSNF